MGCISLMFVVALVSGFFQDGDGIKPKMSPDEDTLFINYGEQLKIECYRENAQLQFSFPESTILVPRSEHEIRVSGNGTYTFLRRHPLSSDTGWYACAVESVEIDNDFRNVNHTDEDIRWIYVYVNSLRRALEDTDVLHYPQTIISVPGSVVVIPCLPPRPWVKVELWQNFEPVDLEKKAVRFDPKIGFIMEQVEFLDNKAIFQCKKDFAEEMYIILHAGSKPTMITPSGEDLILQEGNVLKIECSSESKLTFLYPTILTNSSKYEIVRNENGTSTFLRRSVISNDTGWYGCAGMDIENNDIPAYSIDYTKKEISWVYVYVNSSVKIISPLVDTVYYNPASLWETNVMIIPCRPTTPESRIQLEEWDGKIWNPKNKTLFDPKVGYSVYSQAVEPRVYRCVMAEPVRYVSKSYNLADIKAGMKGIFKAIFDVDGRWSYNNIIIRMTGDELLLRCETWAPTPSLCLMEWTVPNTVSANRIKYNGNQSNGHIFRDVIQLRKKTLGITVTNLSETDSGEYICSVHSNHDSERDSRTLEVFDKAGGRYLAPDWLGNSSYFNRNSLNITGRKGETIKWLLDLTHSPSTKIQKYSSYNQDANNISLFEIENISTYKQQLLLFRIRNLDPISRGSHYMEFVTRRGIRNVRINVNVQEPPIARLNSTKGLSQTGGMLINAHCRSFGSPEPNITIVFRECPKYPSSRNCNLKYGRESYEVGEEDGWKSYYWQFSTSMSGILTCEACNILGCSVSTENILFSASDEPYFTSSNLNKTEVVFDMVTRQSGDELMLECYAAGDPYPNVTWFKDDVNLEDGKQHKFADDNRKLSILYFSFNDGGRYTCRAENARGYVENYMDIILQGAVQNVTFVVGEGVLPSSMVVAVITLLVFVVICCIVIYRLYTKALRKKLADLAFEKGALERFNPELSVVDQADLLPYDLKWEYPRGLLKLDKTLGSGAFGIVKKAEAKSICRGEAVTTVAVKMVRSTASLNFMTALTRELKILAYLGKHPNVVNLLGACTKNVFLGELYVIVEYCRYGNLRDHLLNGRADFFDELHTSSENMDPSRLHPNVDRAEHSCHGTDVTGTSEASDGDCNEDQDSGEAERWRSKYEGDCTDPRLEPIGTQDLVYWSWQVSRAMKFLGERKIVHGDLAARNILLADNGIVKVCDFGLAKALYREAEYRDTGANPLPVKWMAIEAIKDRVFSVQSDVWSFGIVMWEFFTLGETPYPGVRPRGLYQKLVDGFRMEHPKYAQLTIYDMMQQCWEADPTKRPSFADLSHNLGDLLDHDFKEQYLEMHAHYMELNAEIADNGKADYLTLSLEATSASKMQEQIEMNSLLQDMSEIPV